MAPRPPRVIAIACATAFFAVVHTVAVAQRAILPAGPVHSMRDIAGGVYQSFYRGAESETGPIRVAPFRMDTHLVTNADYLRFVTEVPRWQRGRVPRVFADREYLAQWTDALHFAMGAERQPVTRVSWFAATAYCESRGATLPTEAQWEYVARADETQRDAQRNRAFVRRILSWYSHPFVEPLPSVGQSRPNVWGIHDMHGLVWEWVLDFNASMINVDARSRGDGEFARFCGGAALGATDTADYAAFMRYAFRSTLRASYTVRNLGFRCVTEGEPPP